ncbi:MAG: NADH:flavin oxidoreductase, partial [Chrysiogenales bacterium]
MNIFSSGQIQALKFKNRIIRSATHEGMADSSGHPLAELGKYYLRLAEGGVGGIITGFTGTQKNGKAVPLMRMFDSDEFIDDYRDIASSMKRTGTPLIMQLAHGGGLSSRKIMGEKEAAPSSVKYKTTPGAPRELSADEITGVISNFIKAIERSRNAGFDGVQVHAAHGYLLAEFLSPYSNRRTDAWGGVKREEGED